MNNSDPNTHIHAPFDERTRLALNANQLGLTLLAGHPFTCGNRGDEHHAPVNSIADVLVATPDGWRCPFCEASQYWAWAFMAEHLPEADPLKSVPEELGGHIRTSIEHNPTQAERFFNATQNIEANVCRALVAYNRLLSAGQGDRETLELMLGDIKVLGTRMRACR